jgi:hypothetical protein
VSCLSVVAVNKAVAKAKSNKREPISHKGTGLVLRILVEFQTGAFWKE